MTRIIITFNEPITIQRNYQSIRTRFNPLNFAGKMFIVYHSIHEKTDGHSGDPEQQWNKIQSVSEGFFAIWFG